MERISLELDIANMRLVTIFPIFCSLQWDILLINKKLGYTNKLKFQQQTH